MWVLSPDETGDARKVDTWKVAVSPREIGIARKMVVPRTKSNNCILNYNCMTPGLSANYQ